MGDDLICQGIMEKRDVDDRTFGGLPLGHDAAAGSDITIDDLYTEPR